MSIFPVSVIVELLLNGTWVDISAYVYQRDPITITGGRGQQTDVPQPAHLTFTVNNRDGRFTEKYTGGAYYPYLARGVQIRLSCSATSITGNFYSGYRFWGKITELPPRSDPSATDVYVPIAAHGPLREIRQGGGKGSALVRYYNTLTGSFAPIAYWPCEEDPDTTIVGAGISGGQNMTITTGTPTWKAISNFNGSAPIGVINNSTWDGLTGSFNTSGDDIYTTPGTYTFVASTATVNAKVWAAAAGGWSGSNTGFGNPGGGAGEFAQEATLALTIGNSYTVVVGSGGSGGTGSNNPGHDGGNSSFAVAELGTGAGLGVLAHGGKSSTSLGGTGSTNTTHHDGGNGAAGAGISSGGGGGGGGGSGGTGAAGHNGTAASGNTGGAGGTPVTGGSTGGDGGNAGVAGHTGTTPGAGGGGGGATSSSGKNGAAGTAGKVEVVYTPQTTATQNIIRFILYVPAHGGNAGKVLLRIKTGSAVLDHLDVLYQTGGKLQLKGFNSSNVQQFASSSVAFAADGQPIMVSAELKNSGANVVWTFAAIKPGDDSVITSATGTVTTAACGNVTEVTVAPNADITKTAMGHISVQYALIPLTTVSKALHGHHTEMGIDRLIRLANEQAMDNAVEFNETADHWGFRTGVQSWTGTNGSVSSSTVWTSPADTDSSGVWSFTVSGTPTFTNYFILTTAQAASVSVGDRVTISTYPSLTFTVTKVGAAFGGFNNIYFTGDAAAVVANPAVVSSGAHSLLLTSTGGAGQWYAGSPFGTSGNPVNAGDIVSVNADVYTPAALGAVQVTINWYNGAGTYLSTTSGATRAMAAGDVFTVRVTGTAPATAAFFAVQVADNETVGAGKLLYIANVRVHPRMGPQTRKDLHKFLEEIEDLDQGILKDAKELNGLKYRTRIRLINQTAAVTLDYSAFHLSGVLEPFFDDQKFRDDITVHRHKGSKVHMNPGAIIGGPAPFKHKKHLKVAAEIDEQLLALLQHLLNLGTNTDERYPIISVNLARDAVANFMSVLAGIEIGDFVKIINLPFWFPASTAKQLVIGYTEVIMPFDWHIDWNCTPESSYELAATSIRRW